VLKKMKRRYLTSLYRDRIATIQKKLPHACIGVDVIVGFPGETEQDFLETYEFLNELAVSYLHVFTYSERDRTEAANMSEVVPLAVRNKRSKMLRGLSVKLRRAFYESQIDTKRTVLFEGENKKGYIHGFTENYVKVKTPWDPALVNTMAEVRLKDIDQDGLVRFDYVENN
jgi:threonylcarbamoyladenosine tRNA methylthiotransferase MtaB